MVKMIKEIGDLKIEASPNVFVNTHLSLLSFTIHINIFKKDKTTAYRNGKVISKPVWRQLTGYDINGPTYVWKQKDGSYFKYGGYSNTKLVNVKNLTEAKQKASMYAKKEILRLQQLYGRNN